MNCLITEEEQDLGKNCDFINVVKIAIPNLRYCKFAVNPLVIGQFHSFKRKKYIFSIILQGQVFTLQTQRESKL